MAQSRYSRNRPEVLERANHLSECIKRIPPWTKIRCVQLFIEAQDLGTHLRSIRGPKYWIYATDTILRYCQYSGTLPLELQARLRDQ
jgi:hypothetical protein